MAIDERTPHEPYDAPPIDVRDDGTFDTVLVCRGCGAEARYNFDPERDPQDEADRYAELRQKFPTASDAIIKQKYGAWCYADFVAWAREDFAGDHDCREQVDAE